MRLLGCGIWAPWKNVTFFLKALAYIPSCDQTGIPLHFQIFDHLGSISWISLRISAGHSPLQSPMSAIISPISLDALKWSDDSVAALRDSATFEDFLDDLAAIPSLRSVIRQVELVEKNAIPDSGGPGRIRTCDQSVMSRPLLPLSYGPVSTSYSMP